MALKMTPEQFRERVIVGVKARIGNEPWFSGVCMDNVDDIFPDLTEAIEVALMDTMYWDAPNHGLEEVVE
jgi:hypothetical protein